MTKFHWYTKYGGTKLLYNIYSWLNCKARDGQEIKGGKEMSLGDGDGDGWWV